MRLWIATFFLIPSLAMGQGEAVVDQSTAKLEYYLNRYSQTDNKAASSQQVLKFVGKLESKRSSFKREKDFLEYLFFKTHHQFLRHFAEYPSFGDMLNTGTYNCLTGTALYALLLDHFGVDYRIIETNYHIFLMAETAQGEILFETTDPTNGFVCDASAIERRIATYRQNSVLAANSSKTYYHYDFDLFSGVNLDQVVGLLHYNLSIAAFNEQQLAASAIALARAIELYQSPRIEAFSKLILMAILTSDLDQSTKERYLRIIYAIRSRPLQITASAN